MDNNDILRRLRYTLDFNDSKMMEIFAHAGPEVSRAQISDWMKRDDDPAFRKINDKHLAQFLNGVIIEKRGKKEGALPPSEKRLNNNIILRKLKIALSLRDDDMTEILKLAGVTISKHELSAFFRNPKQSQYRECKDQIMRNFLQGLQLKLNGPKGNTSPS
jgi:uncharacterized protein YehS (DUF1456 family)